MSAYPGVDVRQAALADDDGDAEFVHVLAQPGWSGFLERPYPAEERLERITVRTERLDTALCDQDYVPTLVKIDVEGAEVRVLRGAIETIARHRPLVVFEHGLGSADMYGTGPDDVWALLVEHARLRVFDLDGGGPYTLASFAEAYRRADRVNFLARV